MASHTVSRRASDRSVALAASYSSVIASYFFFGIWFFGQLDIFILQWKEVPGSGFDLTVLDPSDRNGNRHICIVATKDKKTRFISTAI